MDNRPPSVGMMPLLSSGPPHHNESKLKEIDHDAITKRGVRWTVPIAQGLTLVEPAPFQHPGRLRAYRVAVRVTVHLITDDHVEKSPHP